MDWDAWNYVLDFTLAAMWSAVLLITWRKISNLTAEIEKLKKRA